MGAQHFGNVDLAAAGMPAHGLEERGHAVRIEAGARQDAEADAIGFGFVGAREADLLLDREALRRRHAGHRRVTAAGGCTDEDGREHRRRRHQARYGSAPRCCVRCVAA